MLAWKWMSQNDSQSSYVLIWKMNKTKVLSILTAEKFRRKNLYKNDPKKAEVQAKEIDDAIEFCKKAIPNEGQWLLF